MSLGQEPATLKDVLWDWGRDNRCDVRASQLGWGAPLSENPRAEPLVSCHPAKPRQQAPLSRPPHSRQGRGPHLAAAGRKSSSPKSSPRNRGERRLLRVPWQRRQKWRVSWRRSSAWGCGRAGGASMALACWPHSSRPGVSAAERKQ